jgi:multiple sugar transport system permease protein
LASDVFWHAVVFTVLFTVATVVVEMCLGVAVAQVIDRMTVGRTFAIVSMLVPWAVITVISAQLWSYIFNGVYGIANAALMWLHIIHEPTSFLSTATPAMVALGIADVWKTTPFIAIIALGGLQMIDRELYDAASIDGAGPVAKFRRITLPLLRPALVTALTFRVLQSFGLFDLPFILTHGGPGRSTQTVGVLAYDVLFGDLNFGAGAAISTLTTLMVLIAALIFFRLLGLGRHVADD